MRAFLRDLEGVGKVDYLDYWSLPQKPFAHDASRRFFCGSPQREFIAGLNYLAKRDRKTAILLSPSGCGATSLLRRVTRSNGLGDCAVEMLRTDREHGSRADVLAELGNALGLPRHHEKLADKIGQAIDATSRQSVRTIWLIDRCRRSAAQVACELLSSVPMLSVVAAAELADADRIAAMFCDQTGSLPMHMELETLSLDETYEYVRDSLHMAGGTTDSWTDSAIVRLHEFSGGKIAAMAPAAESAMALAARHQMEVVGPAMVEAANEQCAQAA